jgi:hypothetical protein
MVEAGFVSGYHNPGGSVIERAPVLSFQAGARLLLRFSTCPATGAIYDGTAALAHVEHLLPDLWKLHQIIDNIRFHDVKRLAWLEMPKGWHFRGSFNKGRQWVTHVRSLLMLVLHGSELQGKLILNSGRGRAKGPLPRPR